IELLDAVVEERGGEQRLAASGRAAEQGRTPRRQPTCRELVEADDSRRCLRDAPRRLRPVPGFGACVHCGSPVDEKPHRITFRAASAIARRGDPPSWEWQKSAFPKEFLKEFRPEPDTSARDAASLVLCVNCCGFRLRA